MILSLIVAASENNVIGRDNKLPWHLPDDLKSFRRLTKGSTVIMGRKTFESIGRPLPDRTNIVVSSALRSLPGCIVLPSLPSALAHCNQAGIEGEVFIIGGERMFREAFSGAAQRLYLTRVHATIDGDTFLPPIDWSQWREVSREEHAADAHHVYPFTFFVYERA